MGQACIWKEKENIYSTTSNCIILVKPNMASSLQFWLGLPKPRKNNHGTHKNASDRRHCNARNQSHLEENASLWNSEQPEASKVEKQSNSHRGNAQEIIQLAATKLKQ